MEQKILLITGFEPFGTETRNPSWEAVNALPARIGAWTLEKRLLPVEFGRAAALAAEAIERVSPAAVLCVGLAAGRTAVTPEAIGINLRDAAVADNAGFQPVGEPIEKNGPAAYFSTLPVRKMTDAILSAGVPAKVSYSAGTYVCNDLLYTLLHRLRDTDVRAAFMHIPLEKDLPLSDSMRALEAAINAL